jgi:hypothetical protein
MLPSPFSVLRALCAGLVTAALLAACDCLITVAQTAMHIAGGLNVPPMGLINQYPKWDCGRSGAAG